MQKKRDFAAHAGMPQTNHIINNTKTNNQLSYSYL